MEAYICVAVIELYRMFAIPAWDLRSNAHSALADIAGFEMKLVLIILEYDANPNRSLR